MKLGKDRVIMRGVESGGVDIRANIPQYRHCVIHLVSLGRAELTRMPSGKSPGNGLIRLFA